MLPRITIEEAREILKAHGQPDLLADYEKYSPGDKVKLLRQIAGVDWDIVKIVREGAKKPHQGQLTPPEACELHDIAPNREEYLKRGQFLIRAGKVGAVLLAGGLGTRLGIGKPKGELNIGETRELSVYQCIINNILEVTNVARSMIPLYIMTNDDYRERSEEFFKSRNYFGYPKEMITFYTQKKNVCVDFKGNLFFDRPGHLAESPNGNGGWFDSLVEADLLEDIEKQGIEWLNVVSVDNVLQRVADPVFIGAVVLGGHDSGAKVIRKISPFEKVGVFCLEDEKAAVVEYYEMDDITKNKKNEDGELTYRFGVTLNYLFSVKKLKENLGKSFPMHFAKKKIEFLDDDGLTVEPTEPNGYKFETLAADMVKMMDNCLCYEILRQREFAPIKNATGPDSPDTARKLLEENGVKL